MTASGLFPTCPAPAVGLNRLTAAIVVLTLVLAGCGSPEDPQGSAATERREVIKLAINPWVGYEANAAVIAYLLEHELGYRVERKELKEAVAWQGLESGEVDLIVENWGHDDLKEQYIEDKKVAVEVGPTGNTGVIGWYVPKWLADERPGILSWQGLNADAALFRTPASGGLGQLLDGDPSFVTNDEALVRNLRLDFKVVYAGNEQATIKAALRSAKERTPLLFYFYEPQWLHSRSSSCGSACRSAGPAVTPTLLP